MSRDRDEFVELFLGEGKALSQGGIKIRLAGKRDGKVKKGTRGAEREPAAGFRAAGKLRDPADEFTRCRDIASPYSLAAYNPGGEFPVVRETVPFEEVEISVALDEVERDPVEGEGHDLLPAIAKIAE